MHKRTAKWEAGFKIAKQLKIAIMSENWPQEELYKALQERQHFWDSKTKTWELIDLDAEPATDWVKIRVWADTELVDVQAKLIVMAYVEVSGYELMEQSEAYRCRPPKHNQSRMYLSFRPKR